MPRQAKLGTPRGVSAWKKLESAGDVKRFLAWCIHSVRDQSLDPKAASILGQLAGYLIKTIETSDIEDRVKQLEEVVNVNGKTR